ncbi:hypothetical protein ACROYT_G038255 [Oculina patagonica]
MSRVAPLKDLEEGAILESFDNQRLPSRNSHRSIHGNTGNSPRALRRNSTRRASVRNDIELLDAHNAVDDFGVNDELANPRNVTRPMSERRRFKKSIKEKERSKAGRGGKRKRVSRWKAFRMQVAMSWKLTKSSISHWSRDYELWKGHLKNVEGRFGNGVSSFFVFLKSLLFLNIVTFILEFGLVTLPSVIIENNVTFRANTNSCYFDDSSSSTAQYSSNSITVAQQVGDFISGKGWINTTVMFYAGYTDSILVSDDDVKYNLPLAYLLVGFSYFVCSLFLVVRSLAMSLQESYIESGGRDTFYINDIFAAWDYCITDEKSAKAKHLSITQNFMAQFAEEERNMKVKNRTTMEICRLYTVRVVSTLLVLALLAGGLYAIIFSVAMVTDPVYKQKANQALEGGERLLRFAPSLVITVLNAVLPIIFNILSGFEDWSPGFEVNITLFRTVLLRLASLGVLMIKIYSNVEETCDENPETCCQQNWENEIASQMYMLIWLDFFSNLFQSLVVTTLRKLLYKHTKCFKIVGLPVFDIPKQVLRLVYGECLIWIGTFFSPIMPAMGAVKLIIDFYAELFAVLFNYRPSQKVYRATRSNHLFTVLLLISFFMCLGTVGWGIAGMRPSCLGPFSNVYCNEHARFYDVLKLEISYWPSWIQQIINFVTTVTFIFPILTVVCLFLYYFKCMMESLLLTIETLKDQLALDGKDKKFLMEKLLRYEMTYGKDTDDNLHPADNNKQQQVNQLNKKQDSLAPPDGIIF